MNLNATDVLDDAPLYEAAAAGAADTLRKLDAAARTAGPARRRMLARQVLARLTNNAHYGLARELASAENLWAVTAPVRAAEPGTALSAEDADVLFCLAVLDVQDRGDAERALAGFSRLVSAVPAGHPLRQAAEDGEGVALDRLGRAVRLDWKAVGVPVDRACATCGAAGPKAPLLRATARFPGRRLDTRLLRCSDCTCVFLEDAEALEYADQGDGENAALAFYLHHNAGVWPIIRPIARLDRPAGRRYLDIGCGFGFGLDFAINHRGWIGRGLDPSPHARLGATALGLPIEPRYFEPADAAEKADVIAASEVLEHVADPRAFVALLRSGLAEDGVLVLSTPNGGSVREDAPPSVLTPVLALGAHLVLQTCASLERLLKGAGFAHVTIEENPISLIAYASSAPFALDDDEIRLRTAYRAYLATRIASTPRDTDLWLGLAGRAYQEEVIDRDYITADATLTGIAAVLRARYGIDLDDLATLPAPLAQVSPEAWARLAPFNLPTLLYHRAARAMAADAPHSIVEATAAAASRAARDVRAAMATINADDPVLEHVERDGMALAVQAAARSGSPDTLAHLLALMTAHPGEMTSARRVAVPRAIVRLIAAGKLREAWRVHREFGAAAGASAWVAAIRARLASKRLV